MRSQSRAWLLDIKRHASGFLFISLPIISLFKLAIMAYFFVLLATSLKKQRHHDLIKAHT